MRSRGIGWRVALILGIVAFSLYSIYPPSEKIKLGLDLKGGMHLVLHVVTDDAIKMQRDQEVMRLKSLLKEMGIKVENILTEGVDKIIITGIPADREQDVDRLLKEEFPEWEYSGIVGGRAELKLKEKVAFQIRDNAVEQALETIRRRVDEFGIAEPVIQRQGLHGENIIVELPGVDNPQRVRALIKNTALLELKLVVEGPFDSKEAILKKYGGKLPEDTEIVPTIPENGKRRYYLVEKVAVITGKDIKTARRSTDEYKQPAVSFTLNAEGARRFEKATGENIGRQLAIILDGVVQSAPVIESKIYDQGIIRGRFTAEEAEDLALILRTGSLPASIRILEERTIGPSLGADSIRKGIRASIIALLLVMGFMVFYYRLSGINSVVALILNMLIIFGTLAIFRAALTLPGIAGIVLTIGMAVDANVLIFERIREELRAGKSVIAAIENGFARAFVTIIDANLTTVIAAFFLFQFGTGPIRGFAVTLIIGILASIFTAVFVSRTIYDIVLSGKKKVQTLSI